MPVQNLGTRLKDANDTRTYSINWAAWLAGLAGTDTLSTSTFLVPAPLTLVSQSNTTTVTNVRISGGVTSSIYTIYDTVTSANGEIKRVAFNLKV